MMTYLGVFFASVFLSNIMLYSLDGLPAMNLDKKLNLKDVIISGISKIVVGVIAKMIIYPIYVHLLVEVNYEFLLPIIVVLVTLNLTFIVNHIIDRIRGIDPTQVTNYQFIFLNSVVVSTSLIVTRNISFTWAVVEVFGFLAGHFLLVFIIYTMRPRLETVGVPKAFKGLPLMVITLGLIAMIFLGLAGIL